VETDRKRYNQVLFNLIGNAIKFTPKGLIRVHLSRNESHLITKVTDTGIGISQDDISKLFNFFGKLQKSSKINQSGLGLGLQISKMIVQELHGEIRVSSDEQSGTTFEFSIEIQEPKRKALFLQREELGRNPSMEGRRFFSVPSGQLDFLESLRVPSMIIDKLRDQ